MGTLDIQKMLKALGFDPGQIDGIIGRQTHAAIKAFQSHNGLVPDGIVGPLTRARLFYGRPTSPNWVIPTEHPWMLEAVRLIGITEDTTDASNPLIIGWGDELGIDYNDDVIPWCGLFTAHCIGSQMTEEPLARYPLSARSWREFGIPCTPQLSAIMVFWRGSRNGWQGHVGFYVGEDTSAYHVLGGNQNNSVNVTRIDKQRLLEARWPATALAPGNIARLLGADGKLSKTEQ